MSAHWSRFESRPHARWGVFLVLFGCAVVAGGEATQAFSAPREAPRAESSPTERFVADDAALQQALEEAPAGSVICVAPGVYRGPLRITKPLVLRAVGRRTVIDGGLQGHVIEITAPDVSVEGFIIRNSGGDVQAEHSGIRVHPGAHRAVIRNNVFSYVTFGVYVEKADYVRIEGNVITGKRDFLSPKRGNGIQLYNAQHAQIIGNDISFVRDGIYVDVSHDALFRRNRLHHLRYGTHYMNSYRNVWEENEVFFTRTGFALMEVRDQVVRNNRVWGNSDIGIMLRTLQNGVVEGNVTAGNARGFFIYNTNYSVIRDNVVVDNQVGAHVSAGFTFNQVEHNDFIGNAQNIRYAGTRNLVWGEKAGNYWSQYVGWDRDGDGIGDVPYEAVGVVDRLLWRYPLAQVLFSSPALELIRYVSAQFPILKAPTVIDPKPHLKPIHQQGAAWYGRRFHQMR
ncbi:nitrous oxide reductase family maturation protein NosD [Hydrogenophilus thiooxidans]|uniref:nitrous oxide reductase family maturation protein NosD n=1 Tax=Hydrogenophilus thiooxidans TaxID=2820326 RepID=UPI001C219610|nr:nitrous oxide reductase family maturation protein NosD [Hydrogenophilus thiooxidans]